LLSKPPNRPLSIVAAMSKMVQRGRVVMSVEEYGKKALDARWMAIVKSLSVTKHDRLQSCRKLFSTWKDDLHTFHRAMLCQERELCPTCAWAYNEELVADDLELYQLICHHVGSRLSFGEVEFTLPFEGQRKVTDDNLGELKRLAFETLKEVLSPSGQFILAGVGSTHHWHSSDPFKGWFPHVHFTVIELAFDKMNGRFVRLPMHLSKEQLEKLNQVWAQKFQERYGRIGAKRFVVHWHYGRGYAAFRHRLSYQFRRPVKDAYNAAVQMRGDERTDLAWLSRMLVRPKNEKRHQWYGWLSDGQKSKYLSRVEISRAKKAERVKARRKVYCPLCGDELVCVAQGIPYESLTGLDRYNSVLAFGRPRGGLLEWRK
jgi:hypothetical protein